MTNAHKLYSELFEGFDFVGFRGGFAKKVPVQACTLLLIHLY